MDSIRLMSISALSATTFAVKLLTDGRETHDLVMEVQTTDDRSVSSVRPPDTLRALMGPDLRSLRPIFDAVLAFWRATACHTGEPAQARPGQGFLGRGDVEAGDPPAERQML